MSKTIQQEMKNITPSPQEDITIHYPRERSESHYAVPERFFDKLSDELMSKLPEPAIPTAPVHWWVKVKPIVYLAACFVGLMLCFRLIQPAFEPTSNELSTTSELSQASAEEWSNFYEDYNDQLTFLELERELSTSI